MTEIKKTSVEVTLDGKNITINKLKAGKYYEAQKIYVGMIDSVRVGKNKEKDKSQKVENKDGEDTSVDIVSLYSTFPLEVVKLVSFCIGMEEKELLDTGYPEEITEIAEKVIELNNFNENLKNSVAPLENLGAKKL